MLDAAALLEANLNSVVGADGAFSRMVSQIGMDSHFGNNAAAVDTDMQLAKIQNPTTNPFMFGKPVAGFAPSLPVLNGQFAATDPSRAATESAAWQSTAASITSAVAELGGVLSALSGSAETDWVREAIERVNRIQWAGGQYAAHATAMGVHTGNLAAVASAEKIAAAAAHATWLAAPLAVKPVLEQAYMASFTPRLNAGLIPTVPTFNQLLPPLDAMPGTRYEPDAVEVPSGPSFSRSPLPRIVQEALAANGFKDIAYAETPAEIVERYGNANPQVMDAIAAHATPTEAASLATLPSTSTPGPGALGAGGLGAGGMGAVPSSGGVGGYGQGVNPGSVPAAFAPGAMGAGGPMGGSAGAGAAGGFGRGAGSGRGDRKSGAEAGSALGAAVGAGAAGAIGGFGRGVSGVSGAVGPGGAFGMGAAPLTPAAGAPGGAGTGGGAAGGGQNSSRAMAMGTPMGGGAGNQGGTGRNRKVRAVTSAVERQGNLRALLGEAPAVLPDVIGSNVRGLQ